MTEGVHFGNLVSVELRDAWPHEANDFTPWLCNNLEHLSRVIEIPLELVGAEVGVEEFSADIRARNPIDDTGVLIENQLEHSDHAHLGQILTYLAGLKSRTVVWIAREFSPAHLSALRWLNDHTSDQFAFFAVQVKVVRIGDSDMAPVFEVRERPSEWDRYVQSVSAETSELSEIQKFRRDFWAFYRERYPDDLDIRPGFRNSNAYDLIEGLGVWLSLYLAPSTNSVGLYISGFDRRLVGESPDDLREILLPYEEQVRAELGIELEIDGSTRHFAGKSMRDIEPMDRDNWARISDWFHENLAAYRRALSQSNS